MKIQNHLTRNVRQFVLHLKGMVKRSGTRQETGEILRKRSSRDEDGNILVELALILPTCMMVLTGIFSFAFAYSNELMLTNAVGSGATYLQQNAPYTTDPCSDALTKIEAAAPSLIASNINLTLTINNGTPVTGSSCQSSASSLNTATGIPVNVSATYPCNIHVLNFTISPTCKLTAQTTEYVY
ncbi:MAG: TadE/TadG family type IV pilus assembly protein [Terracidiphilus sp.]